MPNTQTLHHVIAPDPRGNPDSTDRWAVFRRDGLHRLPGLHASEYNAVRYALRLEGSAA